MRNLSLDAAVADTEARYVAANPKSKARFEAATRDMPGGNTRTVLHYDPFPVALVKGEGAYVTDLEWAHLPRLPRRVHGRPVRAFGAEDPARHPGGAGGRSRAGRPQPLRGAAGRAHVPALSGGRA